MKIVEKWVAGFWNGRLILVKWKFNETPKMFKMVQEDDPVYREANCAAGWKTQFRKDKSPTVFDTQGEALEALHARELKTLAGWRTRIEACQERLSKIDDFDLTSD